MTEFYYRAPIYVHSVSCSTARPRLSNHISLRTLMKLETLPICSECGARPGTLVEVLSHAEMTQVTDAKRCFHFDRHQQLYHAGQFPTGLFCIHSGHVKICRELADGTEHIVRIAKPGEVVGYRSLIGGVPYTTSAYALDPATVCIIPRETVLRLLETNKSICLQFISALSDEIEDAETAMVRLARKSVRERLAETLLILAEIFGLGSDGQTIEADLTREELASIVGTTPESVMRRLSELRQERSIATAGRRIRILDKHALTVAADVHD